MHAFDTRNTFPMRRPMHRLLALATLAVAGGLAAAPAGAGPGLHGGAGAPYIERLLEHVDASAEQRTQIAQIMQAARDDLRGQRDSQRSLQTQMREAFAQPAVDEATVESLRQQMLALHDARSQRMTQAMLEASRVLGAEQRQQLAALMAQHGERIGRDGRKGGHGHDGRKGDRGHGHRHGG